ncbi:M50 family metallopeptidase [Mycobacterium paraense]|uniref:M50 family metallopeptidase n=1 Tax=Mycobacterium paraense TaxID=767916 RepID=UPI001154946B|nr:M50 family metallopeptidase [Mycobacterium paraense]
MNRHKQVDNITAEDLAVAFHEAGHAVAAVLFGGRVRKAVLGDDPRVDCDVMLERHCAAITYSGPWAEARLVHGRRPGPRELHRVLAGTSDDEALCAAGGPAAAVGVVALLERCWPAVERVAVELLVSGQVGHAEICTALGLSDEGGPGSFELACIRSGLRGVS